MEKKKTKYKDVTEDFVYMIDAFSCDKEKDKHD